MTDRGSQPTRTTNRGGRIVHHPTPLRHTRGWLEILIVVVVGAGRSRTAPARNMRNAQMVIHDPPHVWSDSQNIIMQHLQCARQIWEVDMLHGKAVGQEWRDFVLVNSRELAPGELRFLPSITGDGVVSDIAHTLSRIWNLTRPQHLTESPAMLVYTDEADGSFRMEGQPPRFRAVSTRNGITLLRSKYSSLPADVAFIFPESCQDTTAHELGHLVAGLEDGAGIMGQCDPIREPGCNRRASDDQKRAFLANSRYLHTGQKPEQGYREGLRLPNVL